MKTSFRALLLTAVSVGAWVLDPQPGPTGFRLVSTAQAIIGLPMTPLSYAGVARRSAYREVEYARTAAVATTAAATAAAATAAAAASAPAPVFVPAPAPAMPASGKPVAIGTVVSALPAGCALTTLNGVQFHRCGSTYYRAAISGSNLVYIAQQP
jgi:hypothetical protein